MGDYPQTDILGVTGGKKARVPLTRKEKIAAELKLLEWHKLANNAAIKAALLQTKSIKNDAPTRPPAHSQNDAQWIKRVIQEEHIKPLEVNKDYVLEYEKREQENADRLTEQVGKHISTLRKLRGKLEARHDLKARTEEYRTWEKEYIPKKQAVMIGKTIGEYEQSIRPPDKSYDPDTEIDDKAMKKALNKGGNHQSSQELSTVLDSLNRLADLEGRISSLEKENQYDQMMSLEKPTANQRNTNEYAQKTGQFEFSKKRVPLHGEKANGAGRGKGPVAMVYEVRNKNGGGGGGGRQPTNTKNWNVKVPDHRNTSNRTYRGGGTAHNGDDDGEWEDDDDDDGGGRGTGGHGFFITEGGQSSNRSSNNNNSNQGGGSAAAQREAARKERLRNQALASAGQKALRERVQAKKGRLKEQMVGGKKHEEAMRELARRKQEQSKRGGGGAAGEGGGKGTAGGKSNSYSNNNNSRSNAPAQKGVAGAGRRAGQAAAAPNGGGAGAGGRGAYGGRGGGGGGRVNNSRAMPARGAAAGVRNKNKHLQEFEQLKAGHRKRREEVARKDLRQQATKGPGIANRYVSQTAPAYNNRNHPDNPKARGTRGATNTNTNTNTRHGRVLNTKTSGTNTRRTGNVPTQRRTTGGGSAAAPPSTAPPMIAVTGMGGLRVIKAGNVGGGGGGGGGKVSPRR